MQSEINIAIKDNPPTHYFSELKKQVENGKSRFGAIKDIDELKANLMAHCIPDRCNSPPHLRLRQRKPFLAPTQERLRAEQAEHPR